MTRNEFEQVIDRCIAREITVFEMFKIFDEDHKKQWNEGEYIYLENIALNCFELIYDQTHPDHPSDLLFIKEILRGEKTWFSSTTLRMPSDNSRHLPTKAKWLLDLVHDSEWADLRKVIMQYRETRFTSPDILEKYWAMYDETSENKTIIDLMKKILYYNINIGFRKDTEGDDRFWPGTQYGEEADPLDFTNKLLRILDFCEGKTFFIAGVNYLNGQPIISLLS